MREQLKDLNHRHIRVIIEAKQEISMIKETIRICTAQIVEIKEYSLVVEISMDKIIEVDQGMNRIIGETMGEEILEGMEEHITIRILGDKNNRGGYL